MKLNLINVSFFGYPNSDYMYEGDVKDNQPHGKGILKGFKDTLSFDGFFENGKPISGKLKESNGDIYEGKFTSYTTEDGAFVDGGGKIFSKEGDVYTGGWYDGEKNGFGTMEYANGSKFEGTWLDDSPDEGEMIFPDGEKYKGSFHQGTNVFDYGELIYLDGYRFVGSFEFIDEQNSPGVYYECEGQIYYANGNFQEGKIKLVIENKVNFDKLMWPIPMGY